MKTRPLLLVLFLVASNCLAQEPQLLFSDDFSREEATPGKEDIGNGWTSNSAWRAKGHQQVNLKDGALHVAKHAEADHGVAVFHDVSFQDGMVELKFKLGAGEDLGLDFVDRELKTVHAGHLCIARVALTGIILIDSKTGTMKNEIREQLQQGKKTPELAELLKTKSKMIKFTLDPTIWHTLHITIQGDTMTAKIDGKNVGSFSSEGIAHPTKRVITLAVNKATEVDDVKVWKLK